MGGISPLGFLVFLNVGKQKHGKKSDHHSLGGILMALLLNIHWSPF